MREERKSPVRRQKNILHTSILPFTQLRANSSIAAAARSTRTPAQEPKQNVEKPKHRPRVSELPDILKAVEKTIRTNKMRLEFNVGGGGVNCGEGVVFISTVGINQAIVMIDS
jgi:hypothetical protein